MDMTLVLKAVLSLSFIGLIAAALLSTASRKFHVEVDERVEAVLAALPGANCGACGNPSCFGAAEAIVAGTAPVSACVAGGQAVMQAIAETLGVEAEEIKAVVSLRACGGGTAASRSFTYSGLMSCNSVARLAGGDLTCQSGCFGYGDCVRACPFEAISLDERGLPRIDLDACTGCGVCVRECPRGKAGLLSMVPENGPIAVRCNSHDKPAARKKYCTMCCIACKKCEKVCPEDAIHVVDLLAVVDYDKCTGCGLCVVECPQKCIDIHGRAALAPSVSIDGCGPDVEGFKPIAAPQKAVQADVPERGEQDGSTAGEGA